MKNQTELKSCPFCGGEARWKYRKPFGSIVCKKCGAMPYVFWDEYEEMDSNKKAVEAWNRRDGDEDEKSD